MKKESCNLLFCGNIRNIDSQIHGEGQRIIIVCMTRRRWRVYVRFWAERHKTAIETSQYFIGSAGFAPAPGKDKL